MIGVVKLFALYDLKLQRVLQARVIGLGFVCMASNGGRDSGDQREVIMEKEKKGGKEEMGKEKYKVVAERRDSRVDWIGCISIMK